MGGPVTGQEARSLPRVPGHLGVQVPAHEGLQATGEQTCTCHHGSLRTTPDPHSKALVDMAAHVRVCAHTHAHTRTYTLARTRTHIRTHSRVHMHTLARTHVHTHTHSRTHSCTRTHARTPGRHGAHGLCGPRSQLAGGGRRTRMERRDTGTHGHTQPCSLRVRRALRHLLVPWKGSGSHT